ncbi:MAG: iron-containing alcohol dehydrogenase [Verrucomicrobia bacterium]|jgi:alcohol dehydrogenase|nr:iron-containing alcohol dehydrogenase [Verrucomicrobiota bacterium]
MRDYWSFFSAEQLVFGRRSLHHFGSMVKDRGIKRVLIVTDPTLVSLGLVDRVLEPLSGSGIESIVFDGGEAEPSVEAAVNGYAYAKSEGADAVIGLGGGSNMDLAKILAILLTHGGHPRDYFHFDRVPGPVLPLICIPTTAGTGSEVSHAAVLTDLETGLKMSTLSPHLRPALAIVDPSLTDACPRQVTADSGIDALTHAIEGYVAIDSSQVTVPNEQAIPYAGSNPMGDLLAERAIRLVGQHLKLAVLDPGNEAARDGMALAATLAGMAFSNCAVAVVHALEYPMGVALHCSHGAGNGLLLPYVMDYNFETSVSKFANVFEWLGGDAVGLSQEEAARGAIDRIVALRSEIGIPHRIRELGGNEDQLSDFASKAFGIKRLMDLNPRVPTEGDLLEILKAAF